MTTRSGVQPAPSMADTKSMTSRPRPTVTSSARTAMFDRLTWTAEALRLVAHDIAITDYGTAVVRLYTEDGQRLDRAQVIEFLREAAYPGVLGPIGETPVNFPRGTESTVPALQAALRVADTAWVVTVLVADETPLEVA